MSTPTPVPADLWPVVLRYAPCTEWACLRQVCRQWRLLEPITIRPGRVLGSNFVHPLDERLEELEGLFNKIDRDQCRIRLALAGLEREGREVEKGVRHMEEMGKVMGNFMTLWRLRQSSAGRE
jgi:hypothetical protein